MKYPTLTEIVSQINNEKTVHSSNPRDEGMKRFREVTNKLLRILKETQTVDKDILYTKESNESMFSSNPMVRVEMNHHLGEYNGDNFKDFTKKIAKMYESAGFRVEEGFGTDDINGFEVMDKDGEVIGEVDFLQKDSIPDMGDTVIIKHKK